MSKGKACVVTTVASIHDFETGNTSVKKYWFNGYANGAIIFADDVGRAAVVNEADAPRLLEDLKKKDSIHTFSTEPVARRVVTWEPRRLRMSAPRNMSATRRRSREQIRIANQQA
jgi:hypothetical protein